MTLKIDKSLAEVRAMAGKMRLECELFIEKHKNSCDDII